MLMAQSLKPVKIAGIASFLAMTKQLCYQYCVTSVIYSKYFPFMKGKVVMSDLRDNQTQSRRNFLKYFFSISLLGFVASVFYPLINYLKPPKQGEVEVTTVPAGKLSEMEKDIRPRMNTN